MSSGPTVGHAQAAMTLLWVSSMLADIFEAKVRFQVPRVIVQIKSLYDTGLQKIIQF